MAKAMSVKKPGSPKRKGPSKEQTQESQVRRRIEQYHEDKALEKALGLSLS
ncbi:conserved hypothetical protein [Vibrio owensii]|uniref:Uncharacterized protein n=1 Tax=Vibrio owensii TaxID=696485 RepID=A0AAU9Q8F2_9VIBR|nr:conserved hypothetical protein [Vibrio owensii]